MFKTFPEGFGIEVGLGQNNLFWSAPAGIMTFGAGPIDRTRISLTPNIRINVNTQFSNDLSVILFTGYNRFGGSSNIEEGYQSKYYFDVVEGGSFFLYNISNFRIGLGLKLNYNINVQFQHITPSENRDVDRSEWFTNFSGDVGMRSMYLFSTISLSLEAWFGLNDLRNSKIILTGGTIRENHYRFLVGYNF